MPVEALPEVRMSDSVFGTTDLDGYLDSPIPICGVLGDSTARSSARIAGGPAR
ncbi:MAG: hypothetical protein ACLUEK_01035 [Oscillospiraceae bacterium]